jgi:hypothetical protein
VGLGSEIGLEIEKPESFKIIDEKENDKKRNHIHVAQLISLIIDPFNVLFLHIFILNGCTLSVTHGQRLIPSIHFTC